MDGAGAPPLRDVGRRPRLRRDAHAGAAAAPPAIRERAQPGRPAARPPAATPTRRSTQALRDALDAGHGARARRWGRRVPGTTGGGDVLRRGIVEGTAARRRVARRTSTPPRSSPRWRRTGDGDRDRLPARRLPVRRPLRGQPVAPGAPRPAHQDLLGERGAHVARARRGARGGGRAIRCAWRSGGVSVEVPGVPRGRAMPTAAVTLTLGHDTDAGGPVPARWAWTPIPIRTTAGRWIAPCPSGRATGGERVDLPIAQTERRQHDRPIVLAPRWRASGRIPDFTASSAGQQETWYGPGPPPVARPSTSGA